MAVVGSSASAAAVRSRIMRVMREYLEYALAWTLLKFFGALPRSVARWTGARFGAFLFRLNPAWRKWALCNLQIAFPQSSYAERSAIVSRMVRNLGWMAAEFAHLPAYTSENIPSAIVLDGFENFADAERQGKGVLFLTGHLGPWELSPCAHALYHQPLYFLVRPINNPRVDQLINRYRCACGNVPIQKNQSARAVLRVLKSRGVVGILADQNTAGEEAVFADFFGVPAATSSGIARMARHTGAPVVLAYGYWDESIRKYRLHYDPAFKLVRTDDDEADIRTYTQQFNRGIENCVRRFPDQWFWVHRRWRNRPPGEQPIYPSTRVAKVSQSTRARLPARLT